MPTPQIRDSARRAAEREQHGPPDDLLARFRNAAAILSDPQRVLNDSDWSQVMALCHSFREAAVTVSVPLLEFRSPLRGEEMLDRTLGRRTEETKGRAPAGPECAAGRK